jgi:hypothetical protein
MSLGTPRHVGCEIATDVLKDHSAFIFSVNSPVVTFQRRESSTSYFVKPNRTVENLKHPQSTTTRTNCHIYSGVLRGVGGFNPRPLPPKFRSFDKAEPNSQFRGKYIRYNLTRIRVSPICKLSGTLD